MKQQKKEILRLKHAAKILKDIMLYKSDLAKRLEATKKLFGEKVYAVDIHSHSTHSDGRGSVDENLRLAQNAGLDFLFITDHNSTRQKLALKKHKNASWGQEPGAGLHHIGLLNNIRLFKPVLDNIVSDFKRAEKLAPFVWIPHPAGWYPNQWYNKEQVDSLHDLGDNFAMEIINGANKLVRAYDAFDARAVELWDELLCAGRHITALGGSDAHTPEELGSVWTGVFSKKPDTASLINSLRKGNCFASEAGILSFSANGKMMGSSIGTGKKEKLKLDLKAADSAGIASVKIVSCGKTIRHIEAKGEKLVEASFMTVPGRKNTYYRLEIVANDDRRAFSSPVYVTQY